MKFFFIPLLAFVLSLFPVHTTVRAENSTTKNCVAKEIEAQPIYDCGGFISLDEGENNDPLEPLNRATFLLNLGIEYILIEPIAGAYSELVPEYIRTRVSNILRNLNEPIVLANNLLQGDLEAGRGTISRFLLNTTIGVVGIFDVSTDMGFPYKKEDLGLTFASWGIESGPYLVLPILGPSTIRDACGRLGDYTVDPINWVTFGVQSTSRTAVQILDAKTDNIKITDDIKKNSIDHYASIRTWYTERRKSLMTAVEDRQSLDTPRPDEDEEEQGVTLPEN